MQSHGMAGKDHVAEMFASHGLRCTRQRRALYEALSATSAHPTADELYQSVCNSVHGVSLATVYNTLEAFCQAGLAQKLPARGGPVRYDATTGNHLHVRDEHTGAVADVPPELSRKLLENLPRHVLQQLEQSLGFHISQVQIELVGKYAN